METSLKTGFAQFSLAAQNFGGLQPPSPTGPYAYVYVIKVIKTKNLDVNVYVILLPKGSNIPAILLAGFFQIFTNRGF